LTDSVVAGHPLGLADLRWRGRGLGTGI